MMPHVLIALHRAALWIMLILAVLLVVLSLDKYLRS